MINHRRGIGLHAVLEGIGAVLAVRDAHDGVVEIKLRAYGHKELFVSQLVAQSESAADESFVFVFKPDRVQSLCRRSGIADTGGKEVAVSHLSPETEAMGDVAVEIIDDALVLLLDGSHLRHVLRFLLRSAHLRRLGGSRFGRLGGRCSPRRSRLSLLGFGFLACFLLLLSRLCLLFLLLSSRFLALFECFGFRFLTLTQTLLLLFLALSLGFRLCVRSINSCYTVFNRGCHRCDGSHTHCH